MHTTDCHFLAVGIIPYVFSEMWLSLHFKSFQKHALSRLHLKKKSGLKGTLCGSWIAFHVSFHSHLCFFGVFRSMER